MPIKEHLFDKRIIKRALQEGLLDKTAYQRVLDELPDVAHKIQAPESGAGDDGQSGSTHDTASSVA